MLCEELKLLWEHGIKWNGVTWRVAVINGIWDGKGFESVTKTMGSNSAHGCNVCNCQEFILQEQKDIRFILVTQLGMIQGDYKDQQQKYPIGEKCGMSNQIIIQYRKKERIKNMLKRDVKLKITE